MIRRSAAPVAVLLVLLAMAAFAQQSPDARLRLDDVVREAIAHNPAIQRSSLMIEAQRHKVPQAKALPDPTLSVGWMGDPIPFKTMANDPSSYRSIGAMQMLPLWGKRGLRGEIAQKDVASAQTESDASVRRVTADVKAAYYEYFYTGKAIDITNRDKALLQQISDVTESRYRVGKAAQPDVLRSQVELTMLIQRLTMLQQQRNIAQARLNTLMGRAADAPLPPAEEINRAALPNSTEVLAAAEKSDPDLAREQINIARSRLMADLAKREYRPDLSVGYMYEQRTGMPDMHGVTFSVNIPVFYKQKQQEALKQAQVEAAAGEKSRENRLNELHYELRQMFTMAQTADSLMQLYEKAILPQTQLTLDSSRAGYSVGSVDFQTVLSNFTNLHSYQLEYYRQLADYQIALARLESLTGTALTAAASTPEAPAAKETK